MDDLLKEWVERLGLQEWRIKLIPDSLPCDMTLKNVAGETEWTETIKSARISILKESCYGEYIIPYDFERTLVHELLHLKFCLLGESGNDMQDRFIHQLIDDMARALVCAKRGILKIGIKEDDSNA
ncbi:MAG: hypothetical protein PHE79_11780 [Eubacteriales bacterium]|nr:hypothetical protein [Eubacteriales bacterium]